MLLSGGKRISPHADAVRARLATPGDPLPMARALEMLHTATLLHDELRDQAQDAPGPDQPAWPSALRKPSWRAMCSWPRPTSWGRTTTLPRLNALLARGIMATAEGDSGTGAHHAAHGGPADVSGYQHRQTARLIETAFAARPGQPRPRRGGHGREFGLNLGIAFQLVDDALDYTISESEMGKPAGGDLREGNDPAA